MIDMEKIGALLEKIMLGANLSNRVEVWTQVLQMLVEYLDMSSGYICHHNMLRRTTVSICHYIRTMSEELVLLAGPGEAFSESEFPNTAAWLRSDDPAPRIIHFDAMDPDDPERAEFESYEVKTALFFKLIPEAGAWGYIELWNTLKRRDFTERELEDGLEVAARLSATIYH